MHGADARMHHQHHADEARGDRHHAMPAHPFVEQGAGQRRDQEGRQKEGGEGLKANGQSATALNTTWPRKRSHVTWATGMASLTMRYLPVESSAAKQTV